MPGSIAGVLVDGMAAFKMEAAIAAMELGFFDEFRERPLDVDTLGDRTDAAPHGIKVLLRTLEPSGYVTSEVERVGVVRTLSTDPNHSSMTLDAEATVVRVHPPR